MSIQQDQISKDEIKTWLTKWIAKNLQMSVDEIQTSKSLLDYSLSSITATMLVGDLEDWLGLTLGPTLVWDYPSIDALMDHLSGELDKASTAPQPISVSVKGTEIGITSGQEAQEMLSNLDGLSDQEVSALLEKLMVEGNLPSIS